MKKVIAVVLLLAGIGLGAISAYGYFFSEDQERCQGYRSEAVELFNKASAAEGTAREASLREEARSASAVADVACANARRTQQTMMLLGLGAIASIIVSVVLLVMARKRAA